MNLFLSSKLEFYMLARPKNSYSILLSYEVLRKALTNTYVKIDIPNQTSILVLGTNFWFLTDIPNGATKMIYYSFYVYTHSLAFHNCEIDHFTRLTLRN